MKKESLCQIQMKKLVDEFYTALNSKKEKGVLVVGCSTKDK